MLKNYSVNVDMGVLRFDSNNGGTRQRRKFTTMPHRINMSFTVKITELNAWQTWINDYGYGWVLFPAVNYQTVNPRKPHDSPLVLRFISDLSYGAVTGLYVEVATVAEFAPQAVQSSLMKVT